MKRVLITGIYGQDGFYLTRLLLKKGYCIYGFVEKILLHEEPYSNENVIVYECSINNHSLVRKLVTKIQPDEC